MRPAPDACPWVVLHVPHDSTAIPACVRHQFVPDAAALRAEVTRMTDHHTQWLFSGVGGQAVRAEVSRLVVDVERFREDADEPMARVGMGAVYMSTAASMPLRHPLADGERDDLLATWYDPHHARLTAAVDAALDRHGRCAVIDCHSFPSVALPYECAGDAPRPDICIGSDDFHTPAALCTELLAAFAARGFRVAHNTPFAGALVPAKHYGRDRRVRAAMVEVNRALYVDEATGELLPEAEGLARTIAECVRGVLRMRRD